MSLPTVSSDTVRGWYPCWLDSVSGRRRFDEFERRLDGSANASDIIKLRLRTENTDWLLDRAEFLPAWATRRLWVTAVTRAEVLYKRRKLELRPKHVATIAKIRSGVLADTDFVYTDYSPMHAATDNLLNNVVRAMAHGFGGMPDLWSLANLERHLQPVGNYKCADRRVRKMYYDEVHKMAAEPREVSNAEATDTDS